MNSEEEFYDAETGEAADRVRTRLPSLLLVFHPPLSPIRAGVR